MGVPRISLATVDAVTADPNDLAVGSAGAAAAVSYAADPTNQRHVINGISYGYSATPQAGCTLTVQDGATIVRQWPVVNADAQWMPCSIAGGSGNSMTITLSAPGGAIVGYVNIENHYLEV